MSYAAYPSLRDKTVVVSGGATGLGAEFVRQFAAQGARVGFVDIDALHGEALAAEIGPSALFLPCDVRDVGSLESAIDDILHTFGPATILVNNAAHDKRHSIDELDVDYWNDRMAVNLRHQFFAARRLAPVMRAAGGGSIINLGSISAHIDLVDLVGYITAKAGIEGLTRTLARELGGDRIRVNCVIPGWVMTERQLRDWVTPEADAQIDRNQCLSDRVLPADVARMVLWLAADDSAMCTAQNWVVDGGWL
ncbi:SDR family oxidoreductase [Herbiconiux sp. CPCC 205763]|uniref:SDR family oxidoreductase n=1 Tax=Herbiconiux aconitum TaxID=2970913 RepID=A0ABT2GMQ8_9MICO|nr:SDR family oxidoreductase [Herbiconiux aconitum]MCS5717515.1 SDR family oxidoreductase [Herbiconiux aconitum]